MRLKFFMLFVRVECLVCSGFPQYSPIFQVAVIPFEIDVPWYVNLDDCAFPLLLFLVFSVLPVLPIVPVLSVGAASDLISCGSYSFPHDMGQSCQFVDLKQRDDTCRRVPERSRVLGVFCRLGHVARAPAKNSRVGLVDLCV